MCGRSSGYGQRGRAAVSSCRHFIMANGVGRRQAVRGGSAVPLWPAASGGVERLRGHPCEQAGDGLVFRCHIVVCSHIAVFSGFSVPGTAGESSGFSIPGARWEILRFLRHGRAPSIPKPPNPQAHSMAPKPPEHPARPRPSETSGTPGQPLHSETSENSKEAAAAKEASEH